MPKVVSLPRWVVSVLLVGAALDLPISGFLGYQARALNNAQGRLEHVQRVSSCWDGVLSYAVLVRPGPARTFVLGIAANRCAKLGS